ncbi:hypothetical protein NCC78_16790 [Micromonospora phytophila]|uniref:hypothetical protein n=1 Tax=Micromonospora phytophila TaxID=709888 RepID=UPI00202F5504|nr:hypothetical protein [Micromonospora phytophila]MCM0676332.1 hypothetical protein [Micromonospora phytophila]
MSRELSDLYRSLADDADGRHLAVPEVLRRRADRRARVRLAGTALAAAVLVGGVVTGTQLALSSERGPVAPPGGTPSPSPSVTEAVPTPSTAPTSVPPTGTPASSAGSAPPRTPTSIPDRAFFTPPAETTVMPPFFTERPEVLPELCGARLDDGVAQRRTRALTYHLQPRPEGYVPDGSYRHTITIHRAGRADDWMADLRQAVRDCPEQEVGSGTVSRQRLLSSGDHGDESVLFELRWPTRDDAGNAAAGETVRLVRAIRVGDVVTVLWEQGWESTSSDRSHVDDYSRRAQRAVERWLEG